MYAVMGMQGNVDGAVARTLLAKGVGDQAIRCTGLLSTRPVAHAHR
jgi:hypothetical protein